MFTLDQLIHQDWNDLYFRYKVVPIIIKYEGIKYTNDPNDPGGPTKYGWTLNTYKKLIDPSATANTIYNLTQQQSMKYYENVFWNGYGSSLINKRPLALTLLLAQINLGPYRPNKILQDMTNRYCHTNLKLDGKLGPSSIEAINHCKYLWPGYPYILYYYYSNSPSIAPVWKWAKKGLRYRIFHGISFD